jgi:hypothetical protein
MEQSLIKNTNHPLSRGNLLTPPETKPTRAALLSPETKPTLASLVSVGSSDSGVDFGWWGIALQSIEECQYHNAGTCPDCGAGMVRLGVCYSCPACGWGSCGS